MLSSWKGLAIGSKNGKILCYDLLKDGLNIELE